MAQTTVLAAGETASPSGSTVYEVALEEPLIQVPVNIISEDAYALFVEHGSDEVSVVVTSPMGIVLTAGAEEGGHDEEEHDHEEEEGGHEDDEDHEDHEDHEGEEEDEDDSSPATATQWGYAIAASVVVSLCR